MQSRSNFRLGRVHCTPVGNCCAALHPTGTPLQRLPRSAKTSLLCAAGCTAAALLVLDALCSSSQDHCALTASCSRPAHLLRLRCRPPWEGQPACHAAGRAQTGAHRQPGAPAPPKEQPAHCCSRGRPPTAVPRPGDPRCCCSAPLQQRLCTWSPPRPCSFPERKLPVLSVVACTGRTGQPSWTLDLQNPVMFCWLWGLLEWFHHGHEDAWPESERCASGHLQPCAPSKSPGPCRRRGHRLTGWCWWRPRAASVPCASARRAASRCCTAWRGQRGCVRAVCHMQPGTCRGPGWGWQSECLWCEPAAGMRSAKLLA